MVNVWSVFREKKRRMGGVLEALFEAENKRRETRN